MAVSQPSLSLQLTRAQPRDGLQAQHWAIWTRGQSPKTGLSSRLVQRRAMDCTPFGLAVRWPVLRRVNIRAAYRMLVGWWTGLGAGAPPYNGPGIGPHIWNNGCTKSDSGINANPTPIRISRPDPTGSTFLTLPALKTSHLTRYIQNAPW